MRQGWGRVHRPAGQSRDKPIRTDYTLISCSSHQMGDGDSPPDMTENAILPELCGPDFSRPPKLYDEAVLVQLSRSL